MKLSDVNKLDVLYVNNLKECIAYVYFRRLWFMEGDRGRDGRTGIVLIGLNTKQEAQHFVCVEQWRNEKIDTPYDKRILYDLPIPTGEFLVLLSRLTGYGILEIGNPEYVRSSAHLQDLIGIRLLDGQENWYYVMGGTHTDERHINVLSFFLGEHGLGAYIKGS